MTLTTAEAGVILHAAQQVDNRQWDERTATAWAAMIDDGVTLAEALDAVARHFATSTAWMLPAHLNAQIKAQKDRNRELLHAAGPPDYPSDLTQIEEKKYRLAYQAAVKAGLSRIEATAVADRECAAERSPEIEAPPHVRRAITEFEQKRKLPRAEPGDAA